MKRTWWKEAVVYQIYVRSFKDSDGDGIGDLNGIREKIPYLNYLGVDAVYLNPINTSPNEDYGYDISDFYDIMADFGTLGDFQRLLRELHDHGMRLIMDLVINHSSAEHPWFKAARCSRDNPCHDWYIWKRGTKGEPPNNWGSFFGGSAWEYNEATEEYYLHLFSKQQPDFNFENAALREEIKNIIRFWVRLGVDGFRFDAINHIAKDLSFPQGEAAPGEKYGNFLPFVQNLPKVHDYIRELRREAISPPDFFVAGEAGGISFDNAARYTAPAEGQLDVLFHFDLHSVGRGPRDWLRVPVDLRATIKRSFSGWSTRPEAAGWNPVFFSNHDTSRTLSRLGDPEQYREASAKALCLLQMTMRGTPFVYNGDEIGMTNALDYELEDYRDIAVLQQYREEVEAGRVSHSDFLAGLRLMNRDNARTPMQWNAERGSGFSAGALPWIPLNPNYPKINVAEQLPRPDSILNFYRDMIQLRRDNPTLIYGSFTEYLPEHAQIYAYTRQEGPDGKEYLVILNLTSQPARLSLPEELSQRLRALAAPPLFLLGNQAPSDSLTFLDSLTSLDSLDQLLLQPWQAMLWLLSSRYGDCSPYPSKDPDVRLSRIRLCAKLIIHQLS